MGDAQGNQSSWAWPEEGTLAGRKARRYRPDHAVTVGFVGTGHRFTGVLINISESGMMVKCAEDVEPGTMLRAGIEMGQETFRAVVIARRTVPETGIGFEFQTMSPRDRQKLHLLLARIPKFS